jgi:hypothetical protein
MEECEIINSIYVIQINSQLYTYIHSFEHRHHCIHLNHNQMDSSSAFTTTVKKTNQATLPGFVQFIVRDEIRFYMREDTIHCLTLMVNTTNNEFLVNMRGPHKMHYYFACPSMKEAYHIMDFIIEQLDSNMFTIMIIDIPIKQPSSSYTGKKSFQRMMIIRIFVPIALKQLVLLTMMTRLTSKDNVEWELL